MQPPPAQQPVEVRLYGLVRMTRRRYLAQLALGLTAAVVLLGLWWLRWPALRPFLDSPNNPLAGLELAIGDHLPWIILAAGFLQTLEAIFVLRLFARKEAQRAAAPSPSLPEPAPPLPPPESGEGG